VEDLAPIINVQFAMVIKKEGDYLKTKEKMPQPKKNWYERIANLFKKNKVYIDKEFTTTERLVLAKLYLSQYQKTFFNPKSGSYDDLITEINKEKNFSYTWLRITLKKFFEKGILNLDKYEDNQVVYFHINKKEIEKYQEEDWIYQTYLKLLNKQYLMIKQ